MLVSSSSSSVRMLCRDLISLAIQRCRMLDDLCRLSVVLKSSPLSNPPMLRVSISDTGVGSSLEEFQDLKYTSDSFSAEKWDGVISIATTSISENEIYHYTINLKESVPTRRLTKLPSNSKNGAKFSGTEVSLLTLEIVDDLLAEITCFLQKMLILKNPKVAIELAVDSGNVPRLRCENSIAGNNIPVHPVSNIECLRSGLEDYILKHRNSLENSCHSCFSSGECLKVGSGVASTESSRINGWVVEVVIVISESSEPRIPSCSRVCGSKTEVLYFKDFSPCTISQSSLNALTSIDWKTYGLTLRSLADQVGSALLEWENLPPNCHIDIAIHCYHKQVRLPSAKQKSQLDRTLTRKALKLALDDLKEKNAVLSAHAIKICSYAPDLGRTLAGLILSSNDSNFKEECVSLLGLECEEIETEIVEDCIKERIISVIELNDRKPQRSKEAETFLFEDDCFQEPDFMDEEYEGGEEAFGSLDL